MDDLSPEDRELRDQMWRAGELEWKMDEHQKATSRLFHRWNAYRQTEEYEAEVIALDSTLEDVWGEECGRRVGKTSKWILELFMFALKRPGAVLTYATAHATDIGEIIVALAEMLSEDAPPDCKPEFAASKKAGAAGLYFPYREVGEPGKPGHFKGRSVIRLVGLDVNPKGARGRFTDGYVLSEAGFMRRLENLVRAVLGPQLQRRPWAFIVCESSTSEDPLHDFMEVIVPDCKARNAYIRQDLDDNLAISPREKAKAIRMAGGRGHAICEREYYCEQTRDPELLIIPEFQPDLHVHDWQRPAYGCALVAADPGSQDLFGLVFGYYDFLAAKRVIVRSWARRNASTLQVACVIAFYEWQLWGTWPPHEMRLIPVRREGKVEGWAEQLAAEPGGASSAAELHRMANVPDHERIHHGVHPVPGQWAYWTGQQFKGNPVARVSDTDLRLIQDLSMIYGLAFGKTRKDDADAQTNVLRHRIASGSYVYTPDAGPVINHVKGAMWNDKRTDWRRDDKKLGHYDCLASNIYWERNVHVIAAVNPIPPQYTDMKQWNVVRLPGTQERAPIGLGALSEAFGEQRAWR